MVVLAVVCYGPAYRGDFIWDDEDYVTKNKAVRSLEGLTRMWIVPRSVVQWYPMVYTSFFLEYQLWELNPVGYHVVNVLLHAVCALLVWRLLRVLDVPGAWLAAAIFAVHPVEVESVAWITERKNVLSLAFALASMLLYLRFRPVEQNSPAPRAAVAWRYYAAALLLFVLALLSKTTVVTLPAVLLVIVWWKQGRIGARDVWPLVPFFACAAAMAAFTTWIEKYHVGARGEGWAMSPIERSLVAGRALWFYTGKLVWPYPVIFYYPRWKIDATQWWQYLFPIAVLALMLGLWLARNRIGRGPLAAVLIFAGVMAPALGFVSLYYFRYSFVADHFQYHASVALIALAAAGATLLYARLSSALRKGAKVVAAGVLVLLAFLTWRHAGAFRNMETLCLRSIDKNPHSWVAYQNLAKIAAERNEHDVAVRYCQTAVEMEPDQANPRNGLGVQLMLAGRYLDAVEQLERAVEITPKFPAAHNNLADAFVLVGNAPKAWQHYQQAIEYDSGYAMPHCGLGRLLASQGDLAAAQRELEEAVRIDPDSWLAHDSLGLVLRDRREFSRAAAEFERAIKLNVTNVDLYLHLADAFQRLNRPAEAIPHLEIAVRLRPNDPALHVALARALAETSQRDRAVVELKEALQLDPKNAAAIEQLRSLER